MACYIRLHTNLLTMVFLPHKLLMFYDRNTTFIVLCYILFCFDVVRWKRNRVEHNANYAKIERQINQRKCALFGLL